MARPSQTPDEVRRVLRSWIGVEVLTPEKVEPGDWNAYARDQCGQLRNRRTQAAAGRDYWLAPRDEDAPPWRILRHHEPAARSSGEEESGRDAGADSPRTGDRPEPRAPRPWFKVVLGAMPAPPSIMQLDTIFTEDVDEDRVDRKTKGNILAATVLLDEWGVMVPDTLAIASFAWGLGRLIADGKRADLGEWESREDALVAEFAGLLAPTGPNGRPRSLTWHDLRDVSHHLRATLGVPADLWIVAPCAIRIDRKDPPSADLLSSFFLGDLSRVEREAEALPTAASSYLGLLPPGEPWDVLTDRGRLSRLLEPELFPPGRWPGPGLHPLTLLQQAAVNAVARDLQEEGLAAINGPPGTGKTTLLRDIVAHVVVERARRLAEIDDPSKGIGNLDLMDYAVVVASYNNAAVENVSLELPVRKKALDETIWHDAGLSYFSETATHLLKLPADAAEEEKAWGLVAARLGNSDNRYEFFQRFWYDKDWGLNEWLDRVWSPDQERYKDREPSRLTRADPPPRRQQARAEWQIAKAEFGKALDHCLRLRARLEEVSRGDTRLRALESALPAAREACARLEAEQEDAKKAAAAFETHHRSLKAEETAELAKLSALREVRPGLFDRLLRTTAWAAYQQRMYDRLQAVDGMQKAVKAAGHDLEAARSTLRGADAARRKASEDLQRMESERDALLRRVGDASAELGSSYPAPGFWSLPDDALQKAAPWNGGAFRDARDALFLAAMRLHRAFVVAGVARLKPSLNAIAANSRSRPPTAQDWGIFFLLVPVVSTTFSSFARMFPQMQDASIGWLLIDEAGQACPQHAMGAIWRARRAVVIGDPLQIPPVATTPEQTTAEIFRTQRLEPAPWAAPAISAQSLADRASRIQARFPSAGNDAGDFRVTGFPLLVHRRCESPMFEISNRIAYADRMVHATTPASSVIRNLLGPSAWVHIEAPSADKWVAEEGLLVDRAIGALSKHLGAAPDIYVISPFRIPALNLRNLLGAGEDAEPGFGAGRPSLSGRVGTVHSFQGKEAESVILVLGAGRGAKPGSRKWAAGTPNLLNVAATRAKRSLYIVGNHDLWSGVGYFTEAADMLPVVSAEDWLSAIEDRS